MTYVIVNDGNLSGASLRVPALTQALLAGPLRITVEHDTAIGGLGSSSTDAAGLAARAELTLHVQKLFQGWQALLQRGVDDLAIGQASSIIAPVLLSRLTRQQQRDFLVQAQDRLDRDAAIVLDVVNDLSISVGEAGRRLATFAENYHELIQAQLSTAAKGLWQQLWDDFWEALEKTTGKLAAGVGVVFRKGADAVTSTSPTTLIITGAIALGIIAYVWRSFR